MIPGAPWIASAVEGCLSFYLGLAEQVPVQVSDDGCSLHFTPHGLPHPTLAVIDQWGPSRATLMDAQNQIDATFSQDAVDLALTELPILQMHDATKHLIELLGFTIVFVYSAAVPEVYLRVNRFDVHWSEEDIKYVPTKKLRNTSTVKPLLAMAYRKIRQALREARTDQSPTAESISSQHDQIPVPDLRRESSPVGGSQQLQSQMPALHKSHAIQNTGNAGRPSLNGSTDLLRHLESDPSKFSRTTSQPSGPEQISTAQDSHDANSPASGALQDSRLNGDSGIQNSRNIELSASQRQQSRTPDIPQSRDGSSNPDSLELGKQVEGLVRYETQVVNNRSTQPQNPRDTQTDENELLSKKRPRESTDEPSFAHQTDGLGPKGPNGASSCRKRQCVESEKESTTNTMMTENVQEGRTPAQPQETQQPVTKTDDLAHLPKLSSINPWEGLLGISDHDVTIPKDQAAFFDDKLCFIPPNTGEPTPQGHVPPTLLKQWNDIARRRHEELARKEREKIPPLTTQESALSGSESESESDASEALSWEESPSQSRHINLIPPESSPIKQPSLFRRPTASGDENDVCPSQPTGDNSLDMANACQDASQLELNSTVISSALEASTPRGPEETTANPQPETLEQSDEPARLASKSPGTYMGDEIQGQLARESQNSPKEKSPSPIPFHAPEDSSDDESVMDTSFPQALDESSHLQPFDSQNGEDIPSSGPSLSGVTAREHVQVAQTPAAENTRLCRDKVQIEHPPSDSQQPSPQNKTSSQSRIFNTYRSHGNHAMSDTSYETPNPPSPQSRDEPLQADVMGTQTQKSSGNLLSQNISLPSHPLQTGVVLHSSGPAHRHQDPRLSGSDVPPALISSSLPGVPQTSQFSQHTQDFLPMVSSLDAHTMSSQISPLKQVTSIPRVQEQSPSTDRHSPTRGSAGFGRVPFGTPKLDAVSRREYFVGNSTKYFDEARNVYQKFRDDYPCYAGDFTHFADLCAKLQAFRNNGLHLQRSYLWDDFIIGHLEDYPRHIEECMSQGSTISTYEEFFKDHFSVPRYKKRSLQSRGIEVTAAQSASIKEAAVYLTQTEPARQSEAMVTSFTGSLVNRLSNFHAHSPFEDAIHNGLPDNDLPVAFPATCSSPVWSISTSSSSVVIKQEGSSSSDDDNSRMTSSQHCFLDYEDIKTEPDPAFLDEFLQSSARAIDQDDDMPEVEQPDNENDVDMPVAEDTEFTAGTDQADNEINADVPAAPDTELAAHPEDEEEDYDDDDPRHETASIELGDDDADLTVHLSRAESRLLYDTEAADADEEDEGEDSEPENWFHSLRHLRSPGPKWSDDTFTPFKLWARADQDVRVERRRRGGAKILVDEKGVIRRPTLLLKR